MTPQPLQALHFQPLAYPLMHWTLESQRDLFDLTPEYQRGSVWTVDQRRALIASLLQKIPVGAITYNARSGLPPHFAIIDGKQRIEAVRAFVDSEFTVPGWWFEEDEVDTRTEDVTFSQLTEIGRRRVQLLPMPGLEASVPTVEAEAAMFDLLNTGGTAQTAASIAHARIVAAR